jgi:hypothetical protein
MKEVIRHFIFYACTIPKEIYCEVARHQQYAFGHSLHPRELFLGVIDSAPVHISRDWESPPPAYGTSYKPSKISQNAKILY